MDILTERQQVVQRLTDLTTGSDTEKIMQMIMNLHKVADYFENKTEVKIIPPVLLHIRS